MSASEIWLIIFWLTVATVLARSSFFFLGNSVRLPPRVQHALRYAPAAALAAIVVPDLVTSGGALDLAWTNPRLLAGVSATLFFLATRHMLGTIVVGMAFFTVFRLLM